MIKNFLVKKNKRYNFTSKYNVKLYKKCLSLKLIFSEGNVNQPNLIVDKQNTAPVRLLKCIYARSEQIPLRLLRFFFLLNYNNLMNMGIKFLVAKKLSVYNGNKAKLINIIYNIYVLLLFFFSSKKKMKMLLNKRLFVNCKNKRIELNIKTKLIFNKILTFFMHFLSFYT